MAKSGLGAVEKLTTGRKLCMLIYEHLVSYTNILLTCKGGNDEYARTIYYWVGNRQCPPGSRPQTVGIILVNICRIFSSFDICCYCCLPTPMTLASGRFRCSRLWSTSQLLRPSGQQCSHFGGVCPQIQG